ncbi:hypothetical protein [Nocardia sp. JMUB6875]
MQCGTDSAESGEVVSRAAPTGLDRIMLWRSTARVKAAFKVSPVS